MTFYKMILEDTRCLSVKEFITNNFDKEIRSRRSQFFYKEGEKLPKVIYFRVSKLSVLKSIEAKFAVVKIPQCKSLDYFFLDDSWKALGEDGRINVSF